MTAHSFTLIKFVVASAGFLFIGTVHGVLQVMGPIRAWLDSIGSPSGGPGHMIDPLAHAHINVVGGVVLLLMAVSYYLLPVLANRPLYSQRLVEHTFWWTSIGVVSFYCTLLIFGFWEGYLSLHAPEAVSRVHSYYYAPVIAVTSTIMGIGFWCYFTNIFLSFWEIRKHAPDKTALESHSDHHPSRLNWGISKPPIVNRPLK